MVGEVISLDPANGQVRLPLGEHRRCQSDLDVTARERSGSNVMFEFVLRYSSDDGFVTWQRPGRIEEIYEFRNSSPFWDYEARMTGPSQVVVTTPEPERPPGWIRRTWRSSRAVGWLRRLWHRIW